MISQSAASSLRAVLCLARQAGQMLTTRQIADRTGVPPSYLAKLLHALGRAGLVGSQRGLGGGHFLRRPAEQITLMDVVRAADRSRPPAPPGQPSATAESSALGPGFDRIVQAFERALSAITVAAILTEHPLPALPVSDPSAPTNAAESPAV